jgi:hypothetical protein
VLAIETREAGLLAPERTGNPCSLHHAISIQPRQGA